MAPQDDLQDTKHVGGELWRQNLREHAAAARDGGGRWPRIPAVPAPGDRCLSAGLPPERPSLCTTWVGRRLGRDRATVPESQSISRLKGII